MDTKERCFVMLKPDAVMSEVSEKIIGRIEDLGLQIMEARTLVPTRDQCMRHYNKDEAWCRRQGQRKVDQIVARGDITEISAVEHGQEILTQMADYFMSGDVEALVVEGINAIEAMRKLIGSTEPLTALPGTLRGDFSTDSYDAANGNNRALHNIAHCSDSIEEARREIDIWFPELATEEILI